MHSTLSLLVIQFNFSKIQCHWIPSLRVKTVIDSVLHIIAVGDLVKDNFCETSIHLDAKGALLTPQASGLIFI